MGDDRISRELEAALRPHLRFLQADAPLGRDEPLGDLGLDSMGVINLLMELEAVFGVQVPDELLIPETFETFASLERAVRQLIR